jgi:3-oxo-5alpha-steroid 4-dehydrogenase
MTIGFDANGSGILLGESLQAATRYLDNVGVFRTFVPPQAFGRGMLVDRDGRRFTNEFWYAGRVGRDLTRVPDGVAYLVLDGDLVAEARAELPKLHIFNSAPARIGLAMAKKADNLAKLARKLSMDPAVLQASADQVAASAAGAPDPFSKSAVSAGALTRAPFVAINLSLYAKPVPATTFSLGGLVVDGATGEVLATSGRPMPGLYAAGRTAVGPCSNSCVGGLSLADCVFTGRRAGASAAQQHGAASTVRAAG